MTIHDHHDVGGNPRMRYEEQNVTMTQREVLRLLARPNVEAYRPAGGGPFIRRCVEPSSATSWGRYVFVANVRTPTLEKLETLGLIVGRMGRWQITERGRAIVSEQPSTLATA